MNKLIAKIGVNVMFKMIIYDNFVHADCHGGNILISKIPESAKKSDFQKKIKTFLARFMMLSVIYNLMF